MEHMTKQTDTNTDQTIYSIRADYWHTGEAEDLDENGEPFVYSILLGLADDETIACEAMDQLAAEHFGTEDWTEIDPSDAPSIDGEVIRAAEQTGNMGVVVYIVRDLDTRVSFK